MLGDLNEETKKPGMQLFLELYKLRNLICKPTCYKNLEKPSSTDLILTDSSSSFQNSCAIETDLTNFHKMTITVMKTTFQKLKPKLIYYRDYIMFSNYKFTEELLSKLSMENISNRSNGPETFLQICIGVLDKLAPQKKKYNRGNNIPFMKKPLSWAHMKRSRLRNRFLKNRSEINRINYIKQRNYSVSLLKKKQKTILHKSK